MSFITRCPACATAFKVVPDQLKISDGWVRCGQCQTVFDATLDLQPAWGGTDPGGTPPVTPLGDSSVVAVDVAAPGPWVPADEPIAPIRTETRPPGVGFVGEAGEPSGAAPFPEAEGAASDPLMGAWAPPAHVGVSPPEPVWAPDPSPGSAVEVPAVHVFNPRPEAEWPPAPEPEASLSFVRQAQRRAWWHRTPVRVLTGGLAVLLLVGLLLQWVWWQRDHLAARSPVWRATLERLCEPFGCRIGDWQAPDRVHIESSALLRRAPGRYVFDLVLKNTSPWAVALPAIELTLTDATDAVLVRRVLPRQDWSPHATVVPGMAEQAVRLELALPPAEAQLMTGYRALLFYP